MKVKYNIHEGLLVKNGLCENCTKNCDTEGDISGGRFYAMVGERVALNGNPDALVDLLVNEGVDNDHSLRVGDSFNLSKSFKFTLIEIDDKTAKFSLRKDGEVISEKDVNEGELYTHVERDIMGETKVPVFVTFVETVFAGTDTNLVKITGTWLISTDG